MLNRQKGYWSIPPTVKRERKFAKERNGHRQPASGSTPWKKEDAVNDNFLFQHKYTTKKSHTIRLDILKKLWHNAVDENKRPAYVIDFEGDEYYVIRKEAFEILDRELDEWS